VRVVRITAGFTLLAIGSVLLVLPGPGWLTIAAGLALLGTEFHWAKRLNQRLKSSAVRLGDAVSSAARRRKPK
jgi:uncharacterized protein (TIGR02611 family)